MCTQAHLEWDREGVVRAGFISPDISRLHGMYSGEMQI